MKSVRIAAVLVVLAALAAPGLAVGGTGRLDDLSAGVDGEIDALEGMSDRASVKTRKLLSKVDGILAAVAADADLPGELKAAAKAAGFVEKKLRFVGDLLVLAGDAREGYEEEISGSRDALAALVDGGSLEGRDLRAALKRLSKADRFLAKAGTAASLKQSMGFLRKVALQAIAPPGGGGHSATWVIDTIGFAQAGVGHDFDGDGSPDNALGSVLSLLGAVGSGPTPDEVLQGALEDGTLILLIDMWDVEKWTKDPAVQAGILAGMDQDGDPSDNFSGSEPFIPAVPNGLDGHPVLRGAAALKSGGKYEVEVPLTELLAGILDLPLAGPVVLAGTASPAANRGYLAFAVKPEALVELMVALNPEDESTIRAFGGVVAALADVDTDGDESPDAISGALAFTSVPCVVVQP